MTAITSEELTDISEEVNSATNEPAGTNEARGANGVSAQNSTLTKNTAKKAKSNTGQKRKLGSPTGKTPPRKKDNQSQTIKLLTELIESVNNMGLAREDSTDQIFQLRQEFHSLNRRHELMSNEIQNRYDHK